MKILYAASTFGHIRSFHVPYIKEMIARGHEVDIAGSGSAEGLPAGAGIVDLPFEKSMTSPANFAASRKLTALMKGKCYDRVLVHTSLAAFFVRLAVKRLPAANRPYVINVVHGYLFDENTPALKRYIYLKAERMMAGVTNRLITMNEADLKIAKENHICKSDREIYKIAGFGYDKSRFGIRGGESNSGLGDGKPTEEKNSTHASPNCDGTPDIATNRDDSFRMVYAAEFSARKNQAFLLRVLKELENADPGIEYRLTLAGRGAELESCKALAKELGIADKVEFPGFVNNMEDFYAKSDLSISSARSEGLPFNIMESLACGLPVVATRVKGHTDLIRPGKGDELYGNGELYDFGDITGCVTAIMKVRKGIAAGIYTPQKIAKSIEGYALDAVLKNNLDLMLNR